MSRLQLLKATSAPAPAPVIEVVGKVPVPDAVLKHRFFIEALGNATIANEREDAVSRVVGTANTKTPELYGWGANVDRHIDNTGFMYLLPLQVDRSTLYALHGEQFFEQRLQVGDVVRLWDWAPHWTEDAAPAVAAFVGSFELPQDEIAVQALTRAVGALAKGVYAGAPRVGPGYRLVMDDECWATTGLDEDAQVMLVADAKARGLMVVPCCQCTRPAMVMDEKWPYFADGCLCRVHRWPHLKLGAPTLEVVHG